MFFHGKLHSGIEVPPPKKETLLFKNKDTFFFLFFLEAPFMKRSLKTHSATLKSSKSSSLLFFYGHPSSKILSLGPSADLCSWLDFFCAVLWLKCQRWMQLWRVNDPRKIKSPLFPLFLISPSERSHFQYPAFLRVFMLGLLIPAWIDLCLGSRVSSSCLGISLSPAGHSWL